MHKKTSLIAAALVWLAVLFGPAVSQAQMPHPAVKGFETEWVYRVRYGFIEEWWDLFRKYEVPIFEKLKERGYILEYRIYHPRAHTDEASRWDYRVEIRWKDQDAQFQAAVVGQELFKDTATRKREDRRRWELTTNHWDLPIYQVDPSTGR